MRDRLIALLNQLNFDYGKECIYLPEEGCIREPDFAEFFADHLIANGVIVPPCKVGDIIYALTYDRKDYMPIKVTHRESLVRWMDEDQFENTLFATREEAERALKGETKCRGTLTLVSE